MINHAKIPKIRAQTKTFVCHDVNFELLNQSLKNEFSKI